MSFRDDCSWRTCAPGMQDVRVIIQDSFPDHFNAGEPAAQQIAVCRVEQLQRLVGPVAVCGHANSIRRIRVKLTPRTHLSSSCTTAHYRGCDSFIIPARGRQIVALAAAIRSHADSLTSLAAGPAAGEGGKSGKQRMPVGVRRLDVVVASRLALRRRRRACGKASFTSPADRCAACAVSDVVSTNGAECRRSHPACAPCAHGLPRPRLFQTPHIAVSGAFTESVIVRETSTRFCRRISPPAVKRQTCLQSPY